jgi:hypothetical protein
MRWACGPHAERSAKNDISEAIWEQSESSGVKTAQETLQSLFAPATGINSG